MRLEIIIPDSTRPDLKARLTAVTQRLTEKPELVAEIVFADEEDAVLQRKFTPEVIAALHADDAEMDAGTFFSDEQVRNHFVQKQQAWTQTHPH